jgi:hypothetical protein
MSENNVSGRSRHETPGVKGNQQFATERLGEPVLDRPLISDTALDRLTAVYAEKNYYSDEVARSIATRYLADADAAGIDHEYLIDYVHATYQLPAYSYPTAIELQASGFEPADITNLVNYDDGRFAGGVSKLLKAGASVERIEELGVLGVPVTHKRIDAIVELASMDDDRVAEWVGAVRRNGEIGAWVGDWRTVRRLADAGETVERVAEFANAGINPESVIAHPHAFTPAEALSFSTASGLNPYQVGAYMSHNINNASNPGELVNADTAKAFGPNFAPTDTALLASRQVSAKAARSLRGAQKLMAATEIQKFVKAGIVTGGEYKSWRDLTESSVSMQVGSGWVTVTNPYSRDNPDQLKRILAGKLSGAPVDSAISYKRSGFNSPAQWKTLHKSGIIDSFEWLKPLGASGRANGSVLRESNDREALMAESLASWVKAGGTAQRLGMLQRAGIPVTAAVEHVNTEDLWAAGASYRDAIVADDDAAAIRLGSRAFTPDTSWEWDESTYRG